MYEHAQQQNPRSKSNLTASIDRSGIQLSSPPLSKVLCKSIANLSKLHCTPCLFCKTCGGGAGAGGGPDGGGGIAAPLPGGGPGCKFERGGGRLGFGSFGALPGTGDAGVPRCSGKGAPSFGGFPVGVELRPDAGGLPGGGGGAFSLGLSFDDALL